MRKLIVCLASALVLAAAPLSAREAGCDIVAKLELGEDQGCPFSPADRSQIPQLDAVLLMTHRAGFSVPLPQDAEAGLGAGMAGTLIVRVTQARSTGTLNFEYEIDDLSFFMARGSGCFELREFTVDLPPFPLPPRDPSFPPQRVLNLVYPEQTGVLFTDHYGGFAPDAPSTIQMLLWWGGGDTGSVRPEISAQDSLVVYNSAWGLDSEALTLVTDYITFATQGTAQISAWFHKAPALAARSPKCTTELDDNPDVRLVARLTRLPVPLWSPAPVPHIAAGRQVTDAVRTRYRLGAFLVESFAVTPSAADAEVRGPSAPSLVNPPAPE